MLCPLSLPADATVAAALEQARGELRTTGIDAGIDWDGAMTGVWGVRCGREFVPRDGDRIELYRALTVDPRHRRRQRVRAARET